MSTLKLRERIWKEHRFPRLRSTLFDLAVLSQNIPQFLLWRYYSVARYGRSRWIRGNSDRLLVRSDDYRAYTIAKSGGTQKGTIKIWQSLAALRPSFIVDVGANYGEFTSSTARLEIPTLAIEANPWIADCLKLTFANMNNVSVINAAIMDFDGEMPFYFNPNYSGISSLSRETINANWAWGRGKQVREVNIKTHRLESLLARKFLGPSRPTFKSIILKIDIEGFEYPSIKGIFSLLKKCDWWRAILEFHAPTIKKAGQNVDEIWNKYRSFNGTIIDDALIQNVLKNNNVLKRLQSSLPAAIPTRGSDLLIGEGFVS